MQTARVVHAGIDYVTFMVVVGSFFVVSGGIHLRVRAPSSAMRNTLFLLCRRAAGKPDRDHRRFDAAHSALDCDEQQADRTNAHRVLHFSGQ